ncbi:hypothetical protein ABZ816_08335 [Actinosynnema sp. NPDC047251]|uniref:Uncharacterized protein n=1 Tax=Saccharothrix espanaensis (strain ATCC 51144 / DSM 44229 / JCM 9112 / NBRC 15066 / NRRL 15764) TaxID=1179773 RepID=K0JNP3_SACES|nr:hypothetical protein [Saccharothrix espanaensis]CCH27535.1 hypothetical protein BN6_02020 [Saccharothrix espanaensis DSM 44229]
MSYEEKGTWVYLVVSLVTYAAYLIRLVDLAAGGALADAPYTGALLWAVGVSIALSVVGRVGFEIVKPSERRTGDVRDKEVNRRGEYVGGLLVTIGMVLPFALAVVEARHFWIANAMYTVFTLGAVVGSLVKLHAYRRGF